MSGNISYRHASLVVAATACWGTGTVLSKQVLNRGVAPLTLLIIELAVSSLFLFVIVMAKRVRLNWCPNLCKLAVLGVLNPGVSYALALLGLVSISASLSVLLWATEPLLILLLAGLLLRERIGKTAVIAVLVSVAGVTAVIFQPGAAGDLVGISLTVGAVMACAIYTVLARKLLLNDGSLDVVFVQQVAALVFALGLAGVAVTLGLTEAGPPTDVSTWILAGVSGVVYYGLAFWLFIAGLRGVTATFAGSLFPLIPVFGLVASYIAGDRFGVQQWIGVTIVLIATSIAGVAQMTRSKTESAP